MKPSVTDYFRESLRVAGVAYPQDYDWVNGEPRCCGVSLLGCMTPDEYYAADRVYCAIKSSAIDELKGGDL